MHHVGKTLRNIRIVDELGAGGMGQVYIGVDERLGRRVAVKAVRPDRRMDQRAKARFLREAQILSRLEHPNICRIYDFIEHEGNDFIVLELVSGTDLRTLASTEMSFADRLDIAMQISRALVAAHGMGIIHRDLKPGNVMVDKDGQVKVLDFGLALAVSSVSEDGLAGTAREEPSSEQLDSEATQTALTAQGDIVGTPGAMSPEQARGEQITAASDMYSLGLVLQELFSGRPYPEGLPAHVLRQKVMWAETQPVTGVDSELTELIERLTSLSPHERPGAVEAFNRLQSVRDRPRKRLRRLAVSAVAGGLVVAAVALGIGLWQTRRALAVARVAQAEAVREATTAREVSDFLESLFHASHPEEAEGGSVTARELLQEGALRIEEELHDQPVIQARLLSTIGRVYTSMGLYQEATALLERALTLREEHLGERHLDTATSLFNLGVVSFRNGRLDEAAALYRRALSIREELLDEEHSDVTSVINNLAGIHFYRGELEEAATLVERILAIEERTLGENNPDLADTLNNLALLYSKLGRENEVEPLYRRAVAILERELGPANPKTAMALVTLANFLGRQERFGEAEPLYRRAIAIQTEVLGPEHPYLAKTVENLGVLYWKTGRPDESEAYFKQALRISAKSLDPGHLDIAFYSYNLADFYHQQGRLAEAEPLYRRALAIQEAVLPPDHRKLVQSLRSLARLLRESGRPGKAAELESRLPEPTEG